MLLRNITSSVCGIPQNYDLLPVRRCRHLWPIIGEASHHARRIWMHAISQYLDIISLVSPLKYRCDYANQHAPFLHCSSIRGRTTLNLLIRPRGCLAKPLAISANQKVAHNEAIIWLSQVVLPLPVVKYLTTPPGHVNMSRSHLNRTAPNNITWIHLNTPIVVCSYLYI